MTRLLHIAASPRGSRSRSLDVAARFLDRLEGVEIETLDLWATALPELDGAMLESRYRLIHGGQVERGYEDRWAELRMRVDHLLSFDIWLFTVPMWNLGMPYRLKHYIDLVIQPTMAFTNDAHGAVTAHGTDKIAVLIGAGALDVRPGAPLAALDYHLAHLAQCLRVYFGVPEIHEIRAAPTFGDEAAVEQAMGAARVEAEALAFTLSRRADGRG